MIYVVINTDTKEWIWTGDDRDEAMIQYGQARLAHSCVIVWIIKQYEHQ